MNTSHTERATVADPGTDPRSVVRSTLATNVPPCDPFAVQSIAYVIAS